jgi:hypothetical protein
MLKQKVGKSFFITNLYYTTLLYFKYFSENNVFDKACHNLNNVISEEEKKYYVRVALFRNIFYILGKKYSHI